MGNSNVCACVFLLSESNIEMLKKSNIKTMSFQFTDKIIQMYTVMLNADVLKKQLNCF